MASRRPASTGFPSYFGIDRNAHTPYVQQWSTSLQHELPGKVVVEARLCGNERHGSGAVPPLQHARASRDWRGSAAASRRSAIAQTFPELGTLFQTQHIGNSIYHSLQIKAEKRFTSRLSFLASFVWSKSIDDADSQVPGQFESFGAQDERNLRLERGLSFFNVRRRLSGRLRLFASRGAGVEAGF